MRKIFRISAFGVAPPLLLFGIQRLLGETISPLVYIATSIVFILIGIFVDQISEWIRSHKRLSFDIAYVLFVLWLGWPWQRVHTWIVGTQVITEKWMSERDTEEFIVDYLKNKREGEVFLTRVRNAMTKTIGGYTKVRYRDKSDKDWALLSSDKVDSLISKYQYDGTIPFSKDVGLEIQYLSEDVRTMNWRLVDDYLGGSVPNPRR